MDTKTRPLYMLSTRTHLETRDTYRLKVKGWKKIFHANRDQKKAGVAILKADKIDFKTKAVKRDKSTTQITIPSKYLIQIWRRNQKLYRQAKAERTQHHQTSSSTNAKGSSLDRKHRKGLSMASHWQSQWQRDHTYQ